MKAVILAGGLGTRLSEEVALKPKPMVEIGGFPILWHIMKMYHHHGVSDFVICCGYKGYAIKEYFANYKLHASNVVVNTRTNQLQFSNDAAEDWRITMIDTGEGTMTGGRLLRVREQLEQEESFCLTYGDGVSDVDITKLIQFHKTHGKAATVTAVRPPSRFGRLDIEGTQVRSFSEKPVEEGGWINGGFFVLSPKVFDTIQGDETVWEHEPLERLSSRGDMHAYFHAGFWQPMDTLRDKMHLQAQWEGGKAPWKCWR